MDTTKKLTVTVRSVAEVAAQNAFALPGDGLLASTSTGAFYLAGPSAQPFDLGDIMGEVRALVSLRGDRHLVAGDNGLFVVEDESLSRSPADAALDGDRPHDLMLTPGPDRALDVWIAGAEHLWLWRSGKAYRVDTRGMPSASAKLAFGAPIDGLPAIWVASEGSLYAIIMDGEFFHMYPDIDPSAGANDEPAVADGIAVDSEGTLWLATRGALFSRGFDGQWHDHPSVSNVTAIAARTSADDLWVESNGKILHHEKGTFRKVPDAPEGRLFGIATSGYALIGDSAGVHRIEAGRIVDLVDINDGDLVSAPRLVMIRAESPSQVESMSAELDGEPIVVHELPWRVDLDPRVLGDGFHSITVTVKYADGGPDGNGRVGFYVGAASIPTWVLDISVLSAERCDECHGERGNAHRLDTKELWMEDIERVLAAVREARMPLPPKPPLQSSVIDRIAAWQAAGFP